MNDDEPCPDCMSGAHSIFSHKPIPSMWSSPEQAEKIQNIVIKRAEDMQKLVDMQDELMKD